MANTTDGENTNLAKHELHDGYAYFSVVSCDQRANDLWNIPTNGPETLRARYLALESIMWRRNPF
jgi:hypothetical protein